MLVITDPETHERLGLARAHAMRLGVSEQLERQLEYLGSYAEGPGETYDRATGRSTRCLLGLDFAPLSFGFTMQKRQNSQPWESWFVGGLIYQGPDIPADGLAPSFTVSLDSRKTGWFVHT